MDSSLKELIIGTPEGVVATHDSGAEGSKKCVSRAFLLTAVPETLTQYKQLKHNEMVAEEVKHNGHVIGSFYFCVTSAPKDKISSYNLFKTYPIRTFKPNFLHDNEFVRFAGPVVYTQHENNEYVLCSSNRVRQSYTPY